MSSDAKSILGTIYKGEATSRYIYIVQIFCSSDIDIEFTFCYFDNFKNTMVAYGKKQLFLIPPPPPPTAFV